MIADRVRTRAYAEAMRRTVRPESVVLDIGTGTGIFALLACQLGARKVYAVEPDDAILLAREIARCNGFGGRIEFLQEASTALDLPERADVVISDLHGVLPWFEQHIATIADARERLLTPGGTLIPARDLVWAAVVSVPDAFNRYTDPWCENEYGLDMTAAQRIVTNTWTKLRVAPEQLLTDPQQWAVLDYMTASESRALGGLEWTAQCEGVGHGLAVWFDSELADGINLTNAPGEPELVYGTAFFPWPKPVAIHAADRISVVLRADLDGGDYVWRWETRVVAPDEPPEVKADFKQSTFFGAPVNPARLRKLRADFRPSLGADGEVNRFVLSLMDGTRTIEEIAHLTKDRFPKHFGQWEDALRAVGELSAAYSR
jgi:protein arginine N-methyltransferase 1